MNYEQKYKDAIERAREYKKHGYMMINAALDNIFPELKESEMAGEYVKAGDGLLSQVSKVYECPTEPLTEKKLRELHGVDSTEEDFKIEDYELQKNKQH